MNKLSLKLFMFVLFMFQLNWSHLADPGYTLSRYSLYGKTALTFGPHAKTATGEGWIGSDGVYTASNNFQVNSPLKLSAANDIGGGEYTSTIDIIGDVSGSPDLNDTLRHNGSNSIRSNLQQGIVVEQGSATVFGANFPSYSVAYNSNDCTTGTTTWTGVNCPVNGQALSTALPAGQYGALNISQAVVFEAGDYDIKSIAFSGSGSITIDKPLTSITRILVGETIDFANGSSILTDIANNDFGRTLLYYEGTDILNVEPGSKLAVTLIAPNAHVNVKSGVDLYGQIMANSLELDNGFDNLTTGKFVAFIIPKISVVGAEAVQFSENNDVTNTVTNNNSRVVSFSLALEEGIDSSGISVQYQIRSGADSLGSATVGEDIILDTVVDGKNILSSGTIGWAENTVTANSKIELFLNDDLKFEGTEYFEVYLYNASVAELGVDANAERYTSTNGVVDTLVYRFAITDDDPSNEAPDLLDAEYEIEENLAINSQIAKLLATDADLDELTFSIIGGSTRYQIIDTSLVLMESVDYELDTADTLLVEVNDGNNGLDTATIIINIKDVNDVLPALNDTLISVSEFAKIGDSLLQLTPNYGDTTEGKLQIITGVDSESFNLDNDYAELAKLLDFESKDTLSFKVEVLTNAGVDTATIIVVVIDENDNAPTVPNYTSILAEDSVVGSPVVTVVGSDLDVIATQSYSIISGNDAGDFAIDAASGLITIAQSLNFEITSSYTLTVEVSSQGETVTSTVTITITDVNDNAPTVPDYTVELAENIAVGTSVETVVGTDLDTSATLSYAITAGNTGSAFSINASTGEIVTSTTLDFETTSSYTLTVEVTSEGETVTSTVTITITDVNDNAPTVPDYTVELVENIAVGTSVETVVGTDLDTSATLSYAITAGNTGSAFSIDASTGEIVTSTTLDFETTSSYTLTVEVSSQGETVNSTVEITITDVNDNAPTVPNYTSILAEDSLVGSPVVTVVGSDLDVIATQSYSIISGNDAGDFAIDAASGLITIAQSLNFETTSSYTLTVEVSSQGETVNSTVEITITDVNDNAPTVPNYTSILAEDSLVGSPVVTVVGSDLDVIATQSYSIISGNDAGDFAIDAASGLITIAQSLNFETTSSYTLTVEVSSQGETVNSTVEITITDVNDNAPTVSDYTVELAENIAVGTSVETVVGTDLDTSATMSYAITAGNTGSAFSIDASTGEIVTSTTLDFETTSSYELSVEVTSEGETVTSTVTITITDVNDNAPTVPNYTSILAEDSVVGSPVVTVVGSDLDVIATQSYSIISGNDAGDFAIDAASGLIIIAQSLNFETTSSYTLTVEVSSQGETVNSTVEITITDVNDNVPTVPDYTVELAENIAVGTSVETVVGTDLDTSATLSYAITAGNTGSAFSIDASTGEIVTSTTLDFETTSSYELSVEVTSEGETVTSTVTITITDVNDNAPTVPDYTVELAENIVVGTSVETVVGTDLDTSATLSYAITAGNTGSAFSIDASTGEIVTSTTLDFETTSSYTLTVEVSSQGETVNSTVEITITDVNDNAPTVPNYTSILAEDSVVGSPVVTVVGSDLDVIATQSYSIISGNDAGDFAIDAASGLITIAQSLNFETTSSYTLTVEVSSQGETVNSTVEITITDVNDNVPTVPDYTVELAENIAVGTSVETVVGTDLDTSATLSYAITAGNTGSAFSIDASTGEIVTSTTLDFETTSSYELSVEVTSEGETVTSTVTITITDVNDNTPELLDSLVIVVENLQGEIVIDTLDLLDLDGDDVIITTDSELFTIDSLTGILSLSDSVVFDYENMTEIILEVTLTDGLNTTLDTIIVSIENVIENSKIDVIKVKSEDSVFNHRDTIFVNVDSLEFIYEKNDYLDSSVVTFDTNGVYNIQEVYLDPTMDNADTANTVIVINKTNPIITTVEEFSEITYVNETEISITYNITYVDRDMTIKDSLITRTHQLTEGVNEVSFEYKDIFGNTTTITTNFVLDTIPPQVVIVSPETRVEHSENSIDVVWTVDGVEQDSLKTESFVSSGIFTIVREAWDLAGNYGSDTVIVDIQFQTNTVDVTFLDPNGTGIVTSQDVSEDDVYNQNDILKSFRDDASTSPEVETYRIYVGDPQNKESLTELVYASNSSTGRNTSGINNSISTQELTGTTFRINLTLPLNGGLDEFGNVRPGTCEDGSPMWTNSLNSINVISYDQIGQFVNALRFNEGLDILPEFQNEKGEVVLYLEEVFNLEGAATAGNLRKKGSGVYIYNGLVKNSSSPSECNTIQKKSSVRTDDFTINIGYMRE